MGGNSKHMPHVWEHYDATFGEVIHLLEALTLGDISATEKFDGVNIYFRVDNQGVVRFSRTANQVATGGFTFGDALKIYESHPAKETMIEGCRAIDEYFSDAWWPFGYSGRDWINAEIVTSFRPQLLRYDENAIVMHQLVTYTPDGKKKLIDPEKQKRLIEFSGNTKTITEMSWRVLSPATVTFTNDSGVGYLTEAVARLEKCMNVSGLRKDNTLREFLRYSLLSGPLSEIRTSNHIKQKLADKISDSDGAIRLVDLKKGQPTGVAEQISYFGRVQNKQKHHRLAMSPIINTIDNFASDRLESLCSVLIEDAATEQDRIMKNIQDDAALINETNDTHNLERSAMFNGFYNQWKQVTSLPAAIEGVTFDFQGQLTKITGGFATLNQLLGVCRYGRGGVPPITEAVTAPENVDEQISPEWFTVK